MGLVMSHWQDDRNVSGLPQDDTGCGSANMAVFSNFTTKTSGSTAANDGDDDGGDDGEN